MKKIILFSLFLCFAVSNVNAQKTNKPVGIISSGSSVKKFHEKSELDGMTKGPLIELYKERIRVLVNTLPFIALTTKQGVTLADVGVPNTPEMDKVLADEKASIEIFLKATVDFQSTMTAFADKVNIVNSILYYESMLKSIETINE